MLFVINAQLLGIKPMRLSGHMREMRLMILNDQIMGVVVEMYILGKDHDVVLVTEQLGHFLQGNTLGFREDEEHEDGTKTGDDDEHLRRVRINHDRGVEESLPSRTSSQWWRRRWRSLAGTQDPSEQWSQSTS